ncbi:Heterokaryon incompatibility protein 6,OR allele [Lachnellula hyalina]|uniref:Heterokaryon incompatibility protein 6,OR allele n=1 Tax=Lachnellula hyalina TaxID=1316788 RepID=A0A8H8QXQ9_9HELO|nr:Heterokaryon incompatibility protein 6,OR allele [Lachnellula hyalina]TVY24436.1 Heterokaryon incompatibility protein 6,OR allele [Lachnellula hyalina]
MADGDNVHEALNNTLVSENVPTKENDCGEKEAPFFEYSPLNIDTQEMRFLILKPHHGNTKSPLDCSISSEQLSKCKPYTYVINTRGNPLSTLGLFIDGHAKPVTRNIVIFLDHIQSKNDAERLWFRDVCLNHQDPEEKDRYWNQEWMDTMIQHAEKVIDLSEVIAGLWDKGELPRPFPPKPKDWNRTREPKGTNHHPVPLHMQKGWVEPPPPHEYLPLDYVCDEFRLVTLWKADNYNDPLRASLAYSVMHSNVTYHCLSYNWGPGDEKPTCTILLNGQTFMIRENLDRALREIRDNVYMVVIWIDAICIDQNNVSERNRQIPRMLEIYDAAEAVISWAGEGDEASDTAIDFLSELQRPVLHLNKDGSWGPYTVKEGDEWKITPIPDLPRRLAALYCFFSRPYFRRIWVVQELAVANLPSLYCGKKRAAWRQLDMAAYHLIAILNGDRTMPAKMMAVNPTLNSISIEEISFIRRMFYFRHLRSKNADSIWGQTTQNGVKDTSPEILDAAVLCRDFQSTSPYDKVFSLLNLAEDFQATDFIPDYSKGLPQAYHEFVVAVACKTKSLDIICAAEPVKYSKLDMPSWCPDWTTPTTVSSLIRHDRIPDIFMSAVTDMSGPIYNTCTSSASSPHFNFKGPVLEVTGIILDTIKIVQQSSEDNFMKWMTTAANECQTEEEKDLPATETPFMTKFWSMLAGDSTGVWSVETTLRETWPPGTEEAGGNLPFRPICIKEDITKHRLQHTSTGVFDIVTRGRALIITENGLMGLAPYYAKEGQKLAILNTCSVPVLLEENQDRTYGFKGSVFVQGWMQGEILEEMGLDSEEGWQVLDECGRLRII